MAPVQIYQATYSGVPVYELPLKSISVMRRQADGWVNATHILKAANFDKPARTRILEKDVQRDTHEKVQGGYGKYQGTWVPLAKARDIARQYDVLDVLEPLFSYAPSSNSPTPAAPKHAWKPRGTVATPAAAPASLDPHMTRGSFARPMDSRASNSSRMDVDDDDDDVGTDAKRNRRMVSDAARALSMAASTLSGTVDTLGNSDLLPPVKRKRGRPPLASRKLSAPQGRHRYSGSQSGHPGAPAQPLGSQHGRRGSISDSGSLSSRSSSPSEFMSESDIDAALTNGNGQSSSVRNALLNSTKHRRTPSGRSFTHAGPQGRTADTSASAATPRNSSDVVATMYSNKLLEYFANVDDDTIPDFLIHPPAEFKINQMIDDEGHTAFHWACAMGDLKIIEVLLKSGADITATNIAGETPLVRAVLFTNNYDRKTFPRLVELLRQTIFYLDKNKQTILHHIAATTSSRSKLSSTRYYADMILAKMSEIDPGSIEDFVNRQDTNGDTALHIAARNGARKSVKVLLGYGAKADIVNNNGRTAGQYISEHEAQKQQMMPHGDSFAYLKSSSSPMQINDVYNSRGTNGSRHGASPNAGRKGYPEEGRYGNGSLLPHMANPHVSEVAIKATHRIAPAMVEYLEELALAYDSELAEKDGDIEQVRQLLEEMKQDIYSTESTVKELQERLGDEQHVSNRLHQASELVSTRALQLRKLVERTQARDLAMLVQEAEDSTTRPKSTGENPDGTPGDTGSELKATEDDIPDSASNDVRVLAAELAALQANRKKLVDEIVELCANAGVGEKMNDYRRLVSLCCGVKIEEIDDLLDGIAQALVENSSDEVMTSFKEVQT